MFGGLRAFAGRFFTKASDGVDAAYGGLHVQAAAQASKDALRFAADAERARNADGPVQPAKIVPPAPRRTAAEERRRIDEMPIP